MDWLIVLIFIIIVILVWLFLMINAKADAPNIQADIHPEAHTHEQSQIVEQAAGGSVLTETKTEQVSLPEAETTIVEPTDQSAQMDQQPVDITEAAPIASRATKAEVIVDDLTTIEGIGPKVNRVLHENGISSFKDLSSAEISRLKDILDKAGFQYMDPGTWPEQAALMAENRMQEFQELIKNLKGGRRTS
jgi:predicted flap endonuclease-1-like 5' DNA nuclease